MFRLGMFHPKTILHSNNPVQILTLMLVGSAILSFFAGYIASIATLVVLIIIHEFGHWMPARMLGLTVYTFSVGFGKTIYEYPRKIWGTRFIVSSIPLGGYIKPDDDEMSKAPIWKRALFISGGPSMNLLCAALITCFSYMIVGEPSGFAPTASFVAQLDAQITNAYDSGLRVGDEFVTIEGQNVVSAQDVFTALQAHQDKPVAVVVKRGAEVMSLSLDHNADGKLGLKGINQKGNPTYRKVGLADASVDSLKYTAQQSITTLEWVGKLLHIIPKSATEQVDASQLQSLIGIVQTGGQFFHFGLADFLTFAAVVSLSLGVLNFLPFPALDGGHLLFLLFEKVAGRAVPLTVQRWSTLATVLFLFGVTIYAAHNDLTKLVGPVFATPLTVILTCLLVRYCVPQPVWLSLAQKLRR